MDSEQLDFYGRAICCVCGGEKKFNELADTCTECNLWVCKECSSYQRQFPFGYICKNCQEKRKKTK